MLSKYIIGIDIGGTKCAISLGRAEQDEIVLVDKKKIVTDHSKTPYQIIDDLCGIIDDLKRQVEKVDAIGVSCGGPLDSKKGIIQSPPNLPEWDNIPIVSILQERYQVSVRLQNDANACALAEWKYGAGKGMENIIFMTFGTGLGAGLILNGRLYSGTNDMAGEVGHIQLSEHGPVGYGKSGSFEGFCSGGGLAQLGYTMGLEAYQNGYCPDYFDPQTAPQGITAKTIADAADAGDETALAVYRTCGKYLGHGIAMLIDILNPQRIVLGSIFARSKNLILPSAQSVIEKEALRYAREVCEVVPAELGEKLGDYAALTVAIYE